MAAKLKSGAQSVCPTTIGRRAALWIAVSSALLSLGACSASEREHSVELETSTPGPTDHLVSRSFDLAGELTNLSTTLPLTSDPLYEDLGGFLTTAGTNNGDNYYRLIRPQIDLIRGYAVYPDGMDDIHGNQLTVQASASTGDGLYCFVVYRFSFSPQSSLAAYEPLSADTIDQALKHEREEMTMEEVAVAQETPEGTTTQSGGTFRNPNTGTYESYEHIPLDSATSAALTSAVEQATQCVLDGFGVSDPLSDDDASTTAPGTN